MQERLHVGLYLLVSRELYYAPRLVVVSRVHRGRDDAPTVLSDRIEVRDRVLVGLPG